MTIAATNDARIRSVRSVRAFGVVAVVVSVVIGGCSGPDEAMGGRTQSAGADVASRSGDSAQPSHALAAETGLEFSALEPWSTCADAANLQAVAELARTGSLAREEVSRCAAAVVARSSGGAEAVKARFEVASFDASSADLNNVSQATGHGPLATGELAAGTVTVAVVRASEPVFDTSKPGPGATKFDALILFYDAELRSSEVSTVALHTSDELFTEMAKLGGSSTPEAGRTTNGVVAD